MIHLMRTVIFTISILSFSYHSSAGTWQDDFSKMNNSKWDVFNIAAWEFDSDGNDAEWEIKNGAVYGSMRQFFKKSMFLTGELAWQNYSVSCRAKFVGEEKKTAMLGLILHARIEENKRYMLLINYFDQKAIIVAAAGKLKQGGEPFKGWSKETFEFNVKFNTWYLLSASVMENDRLQFKIKNLVDGENEGEFSIKVKEPIEEGGLTGFLVENADAAFDDISIKGNNIPNGGTYPVEPRSKLAMTWGELKRM